MAEHKEILSIQLSLDGLYFSVIRDRVAETGFVPIGRDSGLAADKLAVHPVLSRRYDRVRVVLDTRRAVFVPAGFFRAELAEAYLETNNIYVGPGDRVVAGECTDGVCCAMAGDSAVLSLLSSLAGECGYYSPLQTNIVSGAEGIAVNIADHAYVTCRAGSLLYAEALPLSSPADLLYYVNMLVDTYSIRKPSVAVGGRGAADCLKLLKKYYGEVSLMDARKVPSTAGDAYNNVICAAYADHKR